MKKALIYFLFFLIISSLAYSAVADNDEDGVPNENDKCPDSATDVVDQFGCSCDQKNCQADDNPCTDDCGLSDKLATCNAFNEKPCPGGACKLGKCIVMESIQERGTERNNIMSANENLGPQSALNTGNDPTSANENLGPQSTLVIVAGINDKMPIVSVSDAKKRVFGNETFTANDFYMKNSLRKVSLTGKVVGPYTLPASACSTYQIMVEAIKAADHESYFPNYSMIVIFVPPTSCTNAGGYGSVGKWTINTQDGPVNAGISWNFYNNFKIVAHELGHNFGTSHANSMECLKNCSSIEYGDIMDIMGRGIGHMNAPHKEEAGWLSENTIITTEGEYLIRPLEIPQPPEAIQQIKLPLKDIPSFYRPWWFHINYSVYYSLEFRQPIDYDSIAAWVSNKTYSGVFMYYSAVPSLPYSFQTNIINLDDFSIQDGRKSLLNPDRPFIDEINNYEISVKSIGPEGAFVKIVPFSGENQTPSNLSVKFKITNPLDVAWFDYAGNIAIKGTLEQNSNFQATDNFAFKIRNNGNDVLIIENNGSMYIDGTLFENQTTIFSDINKNDFRIKNKGILVVNINESGYVLLRGTLTENGNMT